MSMTQADAIRKIDALLAKAASTTFPAEAEALRAKAGQLTAKYNVTEAARFPWRTASRPTYERTYRASTKTVTVDFVFTDNNWSLPGKRLLTDVVAQATECRTRFMASTGSKDQHVHVSGKEDAVARFQTMHRKAMTSAMASCPREVKTSKRALSSYLDGFSQAVEERFRVFSLERANRGGGDRQAWKVGYAEGQRASL